MRRRLRLEDIVEPHHLDLPRDGRGGRSARRTARTAGRPTSYRPRPSPPTSAPPGGGADAGSGGGVVRLALSRLQVDPRHPPGRELAAVGRLIARLPVGVRGLWEGRARHEPKHGEGEVGELGRRAARGGRVLRRRPLKARQEGAVLQRDDHLREQGRGEGLRESSGGAVSGVCEDGEPPPKTTISSQSSHWRPCLWLPSLPEAALPEAARTWNQKFSTRKPYLR